MINLLSYLGMSLHSEVCLWTLLGLLRSIFDATLFKVNANLKLLQPTVSRSKFPCRQVWHMSMPAELTTSLQRALRTLISGVMLVQCFTVYVYIAAYIVLLYPVFLEEKPNLLLPWLLLAAVRNLLCELTSLALGLGACGVLGPARPPCVKFLINKLLTITPAFYTWLLVLGYYNVQKMSQQFAAVSADDPDYGLELAVRRRRTKSLFNETLLRQSLVDNLYKDRASTDLTHFNRPRQRLESMENIEDNVEIPSVEDAASLHSPVSQILNSSMAFDVSGNDFCELGLPRDADRILEQFVIMMLKIAMYLKQTRGEEESQPRQGAPPGTSAPPAGPRDNAPADKRVPSLKEYACEFKKKFSASLLSFPTETSSQASRNTGTTLTGDGSTSQDSSACHRKWHI